MTDANVQDTPQGTNTSDVSAAFEQGQATEGSSGELSVNDIILGTVQEQDETASAFSQSKSGIPEESVQEQPAQVENQEQPELPVKDAQQMRNDPERYQYWQSKASKLETQLAEQKGRIDEISKAQSNPTEQAPAQQQVVEEFPPPPAKPQKPGNFSREEAYTDSSSESAKHLEQVERWRDTMDEYNVLRTQYETAKVHEKMESIEQERVNDVKKREMQQKQSQQLSEVSQHLKTKHNMNDAEIQDFVTTMSSPDSLTMDNLVQLYKMKNGGSQTSILQGQPNAQPSADFQQVQNAPQVPSPMGVMPSSGNQDSRTTADQVIDSMIKDLNNQNPWKK